MYSNIQDPKSGKWVPLRTSRGKHVLKRYYQNMTGGGPCPICGAKKREGGGFSSTTCPFYKKAVMVPTTLAQRLHWTSAFELGSSGQSQILEYISTPQWDNVTTWVIANSGTSGASGKSRTRGTSGTSGKSRTRGTSGTSGARRAVAHIDEFDLDALDEARHIGPDGKKPSVREAQASINRIVRSPALFTGSRLQVSYQTILGDGHCQFHSLLYATAGMGGDYDCDLGDAVRHTQGGNAREGDMLHVWALRDAMATHVQAHPDYYVDSFGSHQALEKYWGKAGENSRAVMTDRSYNKDHSRSKLNWGEDRTLSIYATMTGRTILLMNTHTKDIKLRPPAFVVGAPLEPEVTVCIVFDGNQHYETLSPPGARPTETMLGFIRHCGQGNVEQPEVDKAGKVVKWTSEDATQEIYARITSQENEKIGEPIYYSPWGGDVPTEEKVKVRKLHGQHDTIPFNEVYHLLGNNDTELEMQTYIDSWAMKENPMEPLPFNVLPMTEKHRRTLVEGSMAEFGPLYTKSMELEIESESGELDSVYDDEEEEKWDEEEEEEGELGEKVEDDEDDDDEEMEVDKKEEEKKVEEVDSVEVPKKRELSDDEFEAWLHEQRELHKPKAEAKTDDDTSSTDEEEMKSFLQKQQNRVMYN